MGNRYADPLFGDIPERLLLSNAPLVRVLGQARFPKIMKISEESYIADFQEAIRKEYPHFQSDVVQGVELNLAGQALQHRVMNSVVWRFFDPSRELRVSLSQDAITLETARYVSRTDFLERLLFVLRCLEETIAPSLVQRVGFRYIDRLQGEGLIGTLDKLIQPQLLNVLHPELTTHIDISMSEMRASTKEGKIIARYGLAPVNYSHDPDMAPPVNERSWVLDVDSYSTGCEGREFGSEMLCSELDKVAARAYAFFRWSITDYFLEKFGVNQ